jgi:hypothetical protein
MFDALARAAEAIAQTADHSADVPPHLCHTRSRSTPEAPAKPTMEHSVIATGHPRRVYHCDSYNNLDRHGRPLDLPTTTYAEAFRAAPVLGRLPATTQL